MYIGRFVRRGVCSPPPELPEVALSKAVEGLMGRDIFKKTFVRDSNSRLTSKRSRSLELHFARVLLVKGPGGIACPLEKECVLAFAELRTWWELGSPTQ